MANRETGQTAAGRPTAGFYAFMGLTVLTVLIIVGYVIRTL